MAPGFYETPWALSDMKSLEVAMRDRFFAEQGILGLLGRYQASGKAA